MIVVGISNDDVAFVINRNSLKILELAVSPEEQ